ncbi:tetratricopeptide repeat protein [Streptomyces sp. NRRL S-813]|uniref:tetratricopeptide repeat protein n=1 Tax=Streptomyces sp. NRRL S-813 TaxID=1463919 RepID=UPI001F38F2E7|nr:tetratricopeptide repeat protein [Streptomyces sp. NRRL S-813]
MKIARVIRRRPRDVAALERLLELYRDGEYEEAEAGARAIEARAGRLRKRAWRLAVGWHARSLATAAACAQGRGTQVLAELESLTAELEGMTGAGRALLLMVRSNRMLVLNSQGRYGEAETEGLDILRDLTRIKHLTSVSHTELCVLDNLVDALCGQDRHEEAEAVARGNLPRAEGGTLAALHCGLVISLNGQGRYQEALTEARRFVPLRDRSLTGRLGMGTAVALHGLGRRSEAEAAAREALEDCERSLFPDHPRIREARALLARVTGDDPPAPPPEEAARG